MTYQDAINQLEALALKGSDKLISAVKALPALNGQKVWRMIRSGKLPAIKLTEYKTTKEIAEHFFLLSIRPARLDQPSPVVAANRKQEINEACKRVLTRSKRAK
jgi:hypothetical protein